MCCSLKGRPTCKSTLSTKVCWAEDSRIKVSSETSSLNGYFRKPWEAADTKWIIHSYCQGDFWALSSVLCSLALVHAAIQAQRGDTIPWPWDTGACVHAHARAHTPQGGQVATPDGEPHGKETRRLAGAFSSRARGERMNIQLAQEDCEERKGEGERCHKGSPAQCKRDYVQCL